MERHLTTAELEAGLAEVRRSPREGGRVELVVRRPATGERELLDEAVLDPEHGLPGDRWAAGKRPNPRSQVTLINARLSALVAAAPERRALAGDQLHVDLDLSVESLPPGSRLAVGSAILELTELPHLGCPKFAARYGAEAHAFVNSGLGQELRLRGANARVVVAGKVRPGDAVRKLPSLPEGPQAALDRAFALVWTEVDPQLAEAARARIASLLAGEPDGRQPGSPRERAWLELVEQFVVSVSGVTREQVEAAGADEPLVSALYVLDQAQRLKLVLGAEPRPVADAGEGGLVRAVRDLHAAAMRLDRVDPVTTELVRLRCARYHDCHT